MDEEAEKLCEEIDAAIFSGDTFDSRQNADGLRVYLARWQRELDRWLATEMEG